MTNCTFLTDDLIFGNSRLDIFDKYGTKCAITDFAILLGGYVSSEDYTTGFWWTGNAWNVDTNGSYCWSNIQGRTGGARPALPYSSIQSISSYKGRENSGVLEVAYGEYPQTIVDNYHLKTLLENRYYTGYLRTTGRKYTTDSVQVNDYSISFQDRQHIEYEYDGKRYIRFVVDQNCAEEILSDGRRVKLGDVRWVRVEPIIWLVDEKADIALSKKILFSGVQFKNDETYNGDFDKTDIKQFMDRYFSKEIVSNSVLKNNQLEQTQNSEGEKKSNILIVEGKESVRKQNPYGFHFDKVSEEDIIRGAVESNISVFLHGKSSEGKSARVKQLDPDCEIIYMRNATPDSLNGKSVYNAEKGEMIDVPPTWYSRVLEKCKAEPNKIHIIFFDELTNALPSIQGMAFNIVLDGEVNGKWKLPTNARIVAAGNDLNDSLAANQMAEPLFNRFAHVYIHTTVDSWLRWASTPKEKYERLDYQEEKLDAKIHPAIYAYIAYKSYSGYDVLRTPYTGDKPNADPRKWEMASKLLYKTKQPTMLRALIGDELTWDFTAFVKQQVISVEDVIQHNYSDVDLEMDISQKFATAVGLSSVDDEHFEVVRDFMKQIGAEPRAAFESMWTHGDEKRLEHLAEIQMKDNLSQGGMTR